MAYDGENPDPGDVRSNLSGNRMKDLQKENDDLLLNIAALHFALLRIAALEAECKCLRTAMHLDARYKEASTRKI